MFNPVPWLERHAALPPTMEAANDFVLDIERTLRTPGVLSPAAWHLLEHGGSSVRGDVVTYDPGGPGRKTLQPLVVARSTLRVIGGTHHSLWIAVRIYDDRVFRESAGALWTECTWFTVARPQRSSCVPALADLVANLAVLNVAAEIG